MATDHIHTSGGIFTHHFIESLQQDTFNHPALNPAAFTMPGESNLSESQLENRIAEAWTSLTERWDTVEREFGTLDITTLRQRWIRPLLYHFGINLEYQRADLVLDGDMRFPLSHLGRMGTQDATIPIHSVLYTAEDTLETRVGRGRGVKNIAPHDMVQRYLNLCKEHDWAIVTDGVYLRLLRDFHHTYTRGYVEFDLQSIFSTRDYSGFRAMFRLLHASRFIQQADEEDPPIEEFYQHSLATGVKVGEDLRGNVYEAIEALANGFLSGAPGFLEQVREQPDGAAQLYCDVLMVIYRMLFLLFAEQRGMLPGRGTLYMEEFSMTAFRTLAEEPFGEDRNLDLWEKMVTTFHMLEHGVEELGIYPYNGALFSLGRTPLLTPEEASTRPRCRNDNFLTTIRHLTTVSKERVLQRISYADLSVEEIGSIYESLLEYTPRISDIQVEIDGGVIPANTFHLDPRGSGRKTTGSYYTPPSLVNELIKSALVPVMEDRICAVLPEYETENTEVLNEEKRLAAEKAILGIKVVDPAAGSGAFLIAANNKLGLELARIRTGDFYPSETEIRKARRDVLANCIYAVDLNPMAVELCKVSLWINAAVEDAPLSFLDHHIKCGNSLVGATPELIKKGIPDGAYNPVTGDDRNIANAIKHQNREERKGQLSLMKVTALKSQEGLDKWVEIDHLAEFDPGKAEEQYYAYWRSEDYWTRRLPYDLWTAAFFSPLKEDSLIPTSQYVSQAHNSPEKIANIIVEATRTLAKRFRFFHWHIEFPQVLNADGQGGFNVVLGNPPWERIKLQEKEFFADKDSTISETSTAAKRRKLINKLPEYNRSLWREYQSALQESEGVSGFLRESGRFPLTAVGDINTYQVFAGLARNLISTEGRAGIIVPSGIATEYYNQNFFQDLVDNNRLLYLYDFQNSEGIFPAVDRNQKFSLLTMGGAGRADTLANLAFGVRNFDELQIEERHLSLTQSDFHLLNPNTLTCPIFHSREAADITKKLYKSTPVFINETTGENPWMASFLRMFDMTNDSNLFWTQEELTGLGYRLEGNLLIRGQEVWLPLYEAKMVHQYDHRFARTVVGGSGSRIRGKSVNISNEEHQDNNCFAESRYYIPYHEVLSRGNQRRWFIGFRGITGAVANIRTTVFSIAPLAGFGNSMPVLLFSDSITSHSICALLCNFNSFVLDFITRHKISGINLNFYIVEQLPILPPSFYNYNLLTLIVPRVLELTYTSWDLKSFADDIWRESKSHDLEEAISKQWKENAVETNGGHKHTKSPEWLRYLISNEPKEPFPLPPFMWNEERRFRLRCELDALYGHLYNLTRDELAYILETFPIVRRKDEEKFGEYRTKRVILEYYDQMVDDPMLDGVCTPLNERVSVLENPGKIRPGITPVNQQKQSESESSSLKPIKHNTHPHSIRPENDDPSIATSHLKPIAPSSEETPQQHLFDKGTDFDSKSTDYGLYRCNICSKMVMGFSLDEHTKEFHSGKDPGYHKLR